MASFWDEFKDLFKTDSQRKEERQNEIAAALEAEKAVTDRLAELDREYRESLPEEPEPDLDALFPESLGLEKVEHTPATDEELAARAQAGVDYEKAAEKRDLEHGFGLTEQALDDRADDAREDLDARYRELGELYEELRKQTDNDAIRRGVARGSIRSSAQQALSEEKAGAERASRAEYEGEMADISAELDALRREQDAAFEELDLKYAAEPDFLAEREKERLEREEQQRREEAEFGYRGAKQETYAERYNIALDFYTSLSPDIAADALAASPSMKYYLGNYYDKLLGVLRGDNSATSIYF